MKHEHKKYHDHLLEQGAVVLPDLLNATQLSNMQHAFHQRLQQPAFNSWNGYHQTDRRRQTVDQLLTIDKAYVDLVLTPIIYQLVTAYLGDNSCIQEAKGWRSLPFADNFHPLHRDEWYCRKYYRHSSQPKSLKLGCYLEDVDSGAFAFVPKSHLDLEDERGRGAGLQRIMGKAGTCFLFDPDCLHQQSYPHLRPRIAVFYHFFSPEIVLSQNFTQWGRYSQVLIESSYLAACSAEQLAFLGAGRPSYSQDGVSVQHFGWGQESR